MVFTETAYDSRKNILANSHYVGVPYDFSALTALAVDGVIRAGTVVPANDASAKGVALHDVVIANDPNGTLVVHGFIDQAKAVANGATAAASAAKTALPMITFM